MYARMRMKILIKWCIKMFFPVPRYCLTLLRRHPSRDLRVLCYHRVNDYPREKLSRIGQEGSVSAREFDEQLAYLRRKGYRSINSSALTRYLLRETDLPSRSILITFDDGYEDNYLCAFPLLKKHGFEAIFFLTTDYIGNGRVFDWDLDGDPSLSKTLTWRQVLEMKASGIAFGSHTKSHTLLTKLGIEEARSELKGSKEEIENRTGEAVQFLAYPFGIFDQALQALAREVGYVGVFTSIPGTNLQGDDAYALKRREVTASDTGFVFKMKVAGALDSFWF